MTLPRVVTAELLDHLSPHDPAAKRSRRDLLRVHRVMGTRAMLSRGWHALLRTQPSGVPLRVLELGAGDGSLLLGAAQTLSKRWPHVELSLLDRQDIVSKATLAGFADLGWSAHVHVADVLAWAARPTGGTGGTFSTGAASNVGAVETPQWDLITASLFLHHFERRALRMLLAAVASRCDRFFACEPRRSWVALAGSHMVGAIGANAVTRQDAVLSVRAGFRGRELTAQWPHANGAWQLSESAAGLFSHCFSARRAGARE